MNKMILNDLVLDCQHCLKKFENSLKGIKNIKNMDIEVNEKEVIIVMKDESLIDLLFLNNIILK